MINVSRIKRIRELTKLSQNQFSKKYNIPLPTLRHWERGDRECPQYVLDLLEFKVKEDLKMSEQKIKGYFTETGIFFNGKEQPPRKTPIILIGDTVGFNIDDYGEDDEISVLSIEENWYKIKKKDLIIE